MSPPLSSGPYRVGLIVDGIRHDVLELSAAGLSLAGSVLSGEMRGMRRGDEYVAVLCLQVEGREQTHDVVIRLAAEGTKHAEFAFATLPPDARYLLESDRHPDDDGTGEAFRVDPDQPAPFEYARLVEPTPPPSRRLIMPFSETVLALTKHRADGPEPPDLAGASQSRPEGPPTPLPPQPTPFESRQRAPLRNLVWLAVIACALILMAMLLSILLL